jgi:DNA-binding XRE family transcriptional regulator
MYKKQVLLPALTLPGPGTFRIVLDDDYNRMADALHNVEFLILPSPIEMTYGFLLKHHREAKGLTQEQLEKLSGIGQKHISNIEKGVTEPRLQTLEKLFPILDKKFEMGIQYLWEVTENRRSA